ncbi:MAG: DUF86 domain-containing protein [Dehalococcoidia bacterium]
MQRDAAYLVDVLAACRRVQQYVLGCAWEDFLADQMRQDAVIRQMEIMGEAANRLSPEARSRIGGVPWQDMIGMRNVLIHGYDAVDLAIVWDTAARRVPGLIEALERHVEPGDPG